MEILHGMAAFALVLIGCGGKLAVVGILVAVQTGGEFYFVEGVLPCRKVAFAAFDGQVFTSKEIA